MSLSSFNERSERLTRAHSSLSDQTYSSYKSEVEQFLAEYPYCYEYWKKLASASLQYAGMEEALRVYQQAINTIPYCWQLWQGYLEFAKGCSEALEYAQDFTPEVIRQLYKVALHEYVGETYMSTGLWKEYLQFSVQQVLSLDQLDIDAITEILDTYIYLFGGVSKCTASTEEPVVRTGMADLVKLHTEHVYLLVDKWPSIGSAEDLIKVAADAHKACYKTDKTAQRLALYTCIDKRPFYHFSALKANLLDRFRVLFQHLIGLIYTVDESHWVLSEAQAVLCICCGYADFWILYIRALAQCQKYDDALEACDMALQRCHSGESRAHQPVFYIEKLHVLELQNENGRISELIGQIDADTNACADPFVVLALAKHYYRKGEHDRCIDIVGTFFSASVSALSTLSFSALLRIQRLAAVGKIEKCATNDAQCQAVEQLTGIFEAAARLTSRSRDSAKALAIERITAAHELYARNLAVHASQIRDEVLGDHADPADADILEAVLHIHGQWLQAHGTIAEIYEAELRLLRAAPGNLYYYVDAREGLRQIKPDSKK